MAKRTDCHRPGAIVPRDYRYLFSVIIPGSDPFERWNTDLAVDAYRDTKKKGHAVWGGLGKCGVCGAHYRYGDVWLHEPTGDVLNLGHDCAGKYQLLADRPEFDAELASLQQRRKAAKEATRRSRMWDRFVDANPGLRATFENVSDDATDREAETLRDMSSRLRRWGSLSPKQVAFALTLGSQRIRPMMPSKPEEYKIAVPIVEGRQVVRGTLISRKAYETAYGTAIKGTIKVVTPSGVWLAWGTLPTSLLGECIYESGIDGNGTAWVKPEWRNRAEVGDEIELQAKLVQGNEPHFAFFKRPTQGRIVTRKP